MLYISFWCRSTNTNQTDLGHCTTILIPFLVNNIHIRTNFSVREVFLDSRLLSSDSIGDEEGVDTVTGGGNESDAVFKDDPRNDNDADDDDDDQKDDDDNESNDAAATDVVVAVIDEMFLDSRLLSSNAIGDDEGVDAVGEGDVTVFKGDPENDNDANDDEDDQEDVFVAVRDGDGGGDDDSGVDCSSGVQCMRM